MPDKTKCMASKAAVDLHDHLKRDMMTLFSLEKVLQKKVNNLLYTVLLAAVGGCLTVPLTPLTAPWHRHRHYCCRCCSMMKPSPPYELLPLRPTKLAVSLKDTVAGLRSTYLCLQRIPI